VHRRFGISRIVGGIARSLRVLDGFHEVSGFVVGESEVLDGLLRYTLEVCEELLFAR